MRDIRASSLKSNPQSPSDAPPTGFDPAAMPVIAQHWFGVEPFRQVGTVAAEIVADLTFRRKVQRLHTKGSRLVGELLGELGAERCLMSVIEAKIDHYLAIPDEALDMTGGHDFPPAPIHEVLE